MVAGEESAQESLRAHFLGWQCRIRQKAVREDGGRPSQGMRPAVQDAAGAPLAVAVTVVIAEADPATTTAEFRHMVRRTQDPAKRYEAAIRFLASAYYQHPETFSDRMTALFPPGAQLATRLVAAGRCVLSFREYGQSYRLPSAVVRLDGDDPFWQAIYWHNALFNPAMPPDPLVIAFDPDWGEATAFPPVEAAHGW